MSPLVVASLFPWIAVTQGARQEPDSFLRGPALRIVAAYPEIARPYLRQQVGQPTIVFTAGGIPYLPDPRFRGNDAIEVYAKAGGKRAQEFFRAEVTRSKELLKSRALYGLSVCEGPKLTDSLLKMLQDPKIRADAAVALGVGGDSRRAIPALIQLLSAERDHRDDRTPIQTLASEALIRFGPEALPALHETLRSPWVDVRLRALGTLDSIGDPRSAEFVWIALGRESNPLNREAFVLTLAKLGDERSVTPLLEQIGEKEPLYGQIEGLAGLHRYPRAREVLRRWAAKGGRAAEAYACVGLTDLRVQWEAQLSRTEQENCANSLGILADPRSIPALTAAMGYQRNYLAPMRALAKIGKPAVPALIRLLGSEETAVRARAAMALGWIGDPAALPHLKELSARQPNDAAKARLDLVLANAGRKVRVP